MSGIPGVNVVAPVVPTSTTDVHPSHEARYGKGGWRTVATLAERDAIPAPRREQGMVVVVAADGKRWELGADLTTWTELTMGGDVTSVAGRTGAVTLTTSDVGGLSAALAGKSNVGHGHSISDVTGLQAALDGKASATDARLTDAREWSASTVSQPEAEAGTATTRRAWTAERVRQAIVAWWTALSVPWSKLSGVPSTFTPSAHAATHASNGSDAIDIDTGMSVVGNFDGLWFSIDGVSVFDLLAAIDYGINNSVAFCQNAANITSGTLPAARLPSTTVTAGSYGSASSVATFTVDATGRLTAAGSAAIAISAGAVSGLASVATAGTFASLTSKPTTLSGYGITDAAPLASPTFTGTVTAPIVVSSGRVNLPSGASGTPAARDIYAVSDTLRYRDSTNTERLILNATDNLANLSNVATARANLGLAAVASSGSASDLSTGNLSISRSSTEVQNATRLYLWSSFR